MNRLEYYDRQKEDWLEDELQALRSRYDNQELTISQIGDLHRRTPGAMASKLKSIGVIPIMWQARGYAEYKNSNLYKEIVESGEAKRTASKEKKAAKIKTKEENAPVSTPFREIIELRNDINILKQDVKEMLRLMNALYDFESSQ